MDSGMSEHRPDTHFDLEACLKAKAEQAWNDMPSEVAIALRKQLFTLKPFDAIKEVGRYYKEGCWSIRPYPDVSGFGELGLVGASYMHKRLRERDA